MIAALALLAVLSVTLEAYAIGHQDPGGTRPQADHRWRSLCTTGNPERRRTGLAAGCGPADRPYVEARPHPDSESPGGP